MSCFSFIILFTQLLAAIGAVFITFGFSQSIGPKQKIAFAVIKKAEAILNDGSAVAKDRAWANKALINPTVEAIRMLPLVLAANSSATVANIQGASDASFQANVDDSVQLFIDADAEV